MEGNLQDKPRKELKQLCSQYGIRTAGVKHDELVSLLREKLYPPVTETPRTPTVRGQKIIKVTDVRPPAKEKDESDKSSERSSRIARTLSYEKESPREAGPSSGRNVASSPDSGLPRKPLLTKSNSTTSRRTDLLRKKVTTSSGVDKKTPENAYVSQVSSRLLQKTGSSRINRKSSEPPGNLGSTPTAATRSRRSGVGANEARMVQINADAMSEGIGSPRASESDAIYTAVEPSDPGSDGVRRVSEIASDAWPDTTSEFSDTDELRSVSSEPISRYASPGNKLYMRAESSKLSLSSAPTQLSFFTERSGGSRDSKGDNHPAETRVGIGSLRKEDLDRYVSSAQAGRVESGEDFFPDFLDGTDFLVGDTDGLEMSFLDAASPDPEETDRAEVEQNGSKQLNQPRIYVARDSDNLYHGTEKRGPKENALSAVDAMAEVTAGEAESHLGDDNGTVSPAGDAERKGGAVSLAQDTRYQESGPDRDGIPGERTGASEHKAHVSGDDDIAPEGALHRGNGLEDESITEMAHPAAPGVDIEDVKSTPTTTLTKQDTDGGHIDGLSTDDSRQVEDVEPAGPSPENAAREEAGDVPGVQLSKVSDVLAPNGEDEPAEIGDVRAALPLDSVNLKDSGDEERIIETECKNDGSEEGIAAAPIPAKVEGAVDELRASAPELENRSVPESETSEEKWIRAVGESSPPAADSAEVVTSADGASDHGPEAGHLGGVENVAPVPADDQDAIDAPDAPALLPKETNVPELEATKDEENCSEIYSNPLFASPLNDHMDDFDDEICVHEQDRGTQCIEDSVADSSVPKAVEAPLEELTTSSPELENKGPSGQAFLNAEGTTSADEVLYSSPTATESLPQFGYLSQEGGSHEDSQGPVDHAGASNVEELQMLTPELERGTILEDPSFIYVEYGGDGEWNSSPVESTQDFASPDLVGDEGEYSIYTTRSQNLEEDGPAGHESQAVEGEQEEEEASVLNGETANLAEPANCSVKRHGSDDEGIPAPPALDDVVSDALVSEYGTVIKTSEEDKVGDNIQENWKVADKSDSKSDHNDEVVSLVCHEQDTGFFMSSPAAHTRAPDFSTRADDADVSESNIETSCSSLDKVEATSTKPDDTSYESAVVASGAKSTDIGGGEHHRYWTRKMVLVHITGFCSCLFAAVLWRNAIHKGR